MSVHETVGMKRLSLQSGGKSEAKRKRVMQDLPHPLGESE